MTSPDDLRRELDIAARTIERMRVRIGELDEALSESENLRKYLSAELGVDGREIESLKSKVDMIRALAGDQLRMHQVNRDPMELTGRIEAILRECGDK